MASFSSRFRFPKRMPQNFDNDRELTIYLQEERDFLLRALNGRLNDFSFTDDRGNGAEYLNFDRAARFLNGNIEQMI